MALLLIMAQQSIPNNASNNASQQHHEHQLLKPIFHDFLGMKPTDSPTVLAPKTTNTTTTTADVRLSEVSPSASASLGASSGGGRGPISATSDPASERQVGNHLEGVSFYGPRSDISGHEISNRMVGSKRSNSDSTFMGSSRDGIPHMVSDSVEGSHLLKILRNGVVGERPRRSNDDEVAFVTQQPRPTSALMFQPPAGVRADNNISKWDRSIPMNVGTSMQYPPRGGHFVPFMPQVPSNRFRDANISPSNISQSAADEGSRTGIKGQGILSSINAASGASERNSSVALPSGSRQKSGAIVREPESSTPPSQDGFASASRQMTIFYGGQAHVFDDVHPNKADVIMALAGSNGGSWSTTYSPKSTVKPAGESHIRSGEVETGNASNMVFLQEHRGRSCLPGNSTQGVGFGDRISKPAGGLQVSTLTKDMRNSVQAAEPTSKEKTEL
ncbi:protein TIFY 8 isoform X2 [Ziziphus jujuba]|uniref:Protein TIFY n=1 Tax=Ziziphus jujuba TaxID=326968 RepID=A0A6P4A021_ZIZJJ|nr:protein TIFY 8 isoform X2 [Ziziphus jujuba]